MTTTKPNKTLLKRNIDPRYAAYQCLLDFERQAFKASIEHRQKADQTLDSIFNQSDFSTQDKGFITALVYGTLRHWFQLNILMTYGLQHFASFETLPSESQQKQILKPLDFKARLILRLGLFQLFWLNSVPDYATISSTLNLADKLKLSSQSKKQCHAILAKASQAEIFEQINALLKSDGSQLPHLPLWPKTFIQSLETAFSKDAIQTMMLDCTNPPQGFWIRINTLKIDYKSYQQKLNNAEIAFQVDSELSECVWINHWKGKPTELPGFHDGEYYIQDISSARIAPLLAPKPGELILDMCAAPGSKTTHMAALMNNQGQIIALESSQKRAQQLKENCAKLGISNVEVHVADALTWDNPNQQQFDRILVDAPCSGSGTIRHQPDSLVQWRQAHQDNYQTLQKALLNKAGKLLKPGGLLLYSTCSLSSAENQEIIQSFLEAHPQWEIQQTVVSAITPQQDGFFACLMQKPEA